MGYNYTSPEFLERVKKRIFYLSSIFIGIAEFSDIFFLDHTKTVEIINISVSVIMILLIALYSTKRINLITANIIITYTILIDIILTPHFQINDSDFVLLQLRLSIVACLFVPYAGFMIHKYHSVIVGVLYFSNFLLLVFISKNEFLLSSLPVFIFIAIGLIIGNFYLVSVVLSALNKQDELLNLSKESNLLLEEQHDKLEQAISSKNRLFAIISHDLKSPFNTILGFTRIIQNKIDQNDLEDLVRYLSLLRHSAEHSFMLLSNLLDWARNEQGTIKYKPKTLLFKNIIQQMLQIVSHDANRKEIAIRLNFSDEIQVFADENMLDSIMRNLAINAVKFTPQKGIISIGASKTENTIEISVSDSGIGLSEKRINELLNSSINQSERGTNYEKGTGLGLSICKEFIEKHEGKLWAKKNIEKGTTFYFTLPDNT